MSVTQVALANSTYAFGRNVWKKVAQVAHSPRLAVNRGFQPPLAMMDSREPNRAPGSNKSVYSPQ